MILAVAAFAAFLATFNETFLNVGFAPIMASLDVDVSTVQWLATAYMLGAAVMVSVSAFAYRSFPTRPLFCVTVLFLADQVPAFKSAWSFVVELDNTDFERTVRETMNTPVRQLAAKDIVSVNATDEIGYVARILAERHLKKVPVVESGKMVGIVNRSNITRYAVQHYFDEA